jgi:hypothetical protein
MIAGGKSVGFVENLYNLYFSSKTNTSDEGLAKNFLQNKKS